MRMQPPFKFISHCVTLRYVTLHYTALHCTAHYTTLHYTTPHHTTLHYTTLHYTTTTLHYTTHYTTLHTTQNYTTLHYTKHYTTLHYTKLNTTIHFYNTQHYTTFALHCITQHYITNLSVTTSAMYLLWKRLEFSCDQGMNTSWWSHSVWLSVIIFLCQVRSLSEDLYDLVHQQSSPCQRTGVMASFSCMQDFERLKQFHPTFRPVYTCDFWCDFPLSWPAQMPLSRSIAWIGKNFIVITYYITYILSSLC